MIKFNEKYNLNQDKGEIIFSEGKKGTINANYIFFENQKNGVINGVLEEQILKGTYHIDNSVGLIEITFHDNGFDAKWKQGFEPGPMRGKWVGKMETKNGDFENTIDPSVKFMNYIKNTYDLNQSYDDSINNISIEDFVEDFSIEFENDFFDDLKEYLDIIKITVDNSEYSIDEQSGSDRFTIYYDLIHNCIYQQYPSNDDDYYKYLGTWHASISSFYKESKKFYGCYSISDLNNEWSIQFQGDFESYDGNIDEISVNKIKEKINSSSFYVFLKEVLESV